MTSHLLVLLMQVTYYSKLYKMITMAILECLNMPFMLFNMHSIQSGTERSVYLNFYLKISYTTSFRISRTDGNFYTVNTEEGSYWRARV